MTAQQVTDIRKRAIARRLLARAEQTLADTTETRDTALGMMLKDMAKYYNAGFLTQQQITDAAVRACRRNGLDKDGANGGIAKIRRDVPRCLSNNADLTAEWERFDWLAAEEQVSGVDFDAPADDGTPTDLADIEQGFWLARTSLQDIYIAALSKMCSPWAVLAICAARALALVRPCVTLPDLIGGPGSLNWFAAITATSGGGKGAAGAVAKQLVNVPVLQRNAGSGEGMLNAYRRERTDDEPAGLRESVMFIVDEIDALTAMSTRSGSTTMPVLRSAFSGEQLGFSYVSKSTPTLDAHSYRMTLVMSVQPARAAALLDDHRGGTPQRLMWFPASDTRATADLAGEFVDPLTLPPASEWRYPRTLSIPDEARALILDERVKSMRGQADSLDGHALFSREKFAYALAILDGRADMTAEDWELSGIAAAVSDYTRANVIRDIERAADDDAAKRGTQQGISAAAAGVSKAHAEWSRSNRLGNWAVGKVRAAGQQGLSEGELRRAARSTDRHSIRAVLDALTDQGVVTCVDGRWVLTR